MKTMTPAEIDTRIADAEYELMKRSHYAAQERDFAEKAESGDPRYTGWKHELDKRREVLAGHQAAIEWCKQVIDAGNEVFADRGGWKRYYLVVSSNGHVHRERYCSTCYWTTQYVWVTDLSDCDEGKMVEEYGEKACTVCFPDAPVHPAFLKSVKEREAEEAAKTEKKCPMSGKYVPGDYWTKRYTKCECGETVAVTKSGKYRAHNKLN